MNLKWISNLIILSFSTASASSYAFEINLYKKPNSPFNKIPVRDQEDLGNCYAYTSADLIDYYRISHGQSVTQTQDLTDPNSLTAASYLYRKKNSRWWNPIDDTDPHAPMTSGNVGVAINAAKDYGYCSFKESQPGIDIAKKDFERVLGKPLSEKDFFETFQIFFEKYDKVFDQISTKNSPYPSQNNNGNCVTCGPTYQSPPADNTRVTVNPGVIYAVNQLSIRESLNRTIDELVKTNQAQGQTRLADKSKLVQFFSKFIKDDDETARFLKKTFSNCLNSEKANWIPKLKSLSLFEIRNTLPLTKFRKKITDLLSKPNPQPISIRYCMQTALNPNYSGVVHGVFGSEVTDECMGHSNSIVGIRTKPNGVVQYLVRNSWGPNCGSSYKAPLECVEGQGSFWIPDDQLYKNLYGINYFEN